MLRDSESGDIGLRVAPRRGDNIAGLSLVEPKGSVRGRAGERRRSGMKTLGTFGVR